MKWGFKCIITWFAFKLVECCLGYSVESHCFLSLIPDKHLWKIRPCLPFSPWLGHNWGELAKAVSSIRTNHSIKLNCSFTRWGSFAVTRGKKVVFSTLLFMARLMQGLAAAAPGWLDPSEVRVQVPRVVTGDTRWPRCPWHWLLSFHTGIKVTACVTLISHVQSPLK